MADDATCLSGVIGGLDHSVLSDASSTASWTQRTLDLLRSVHEVRTRTSPSPSANGRGPRSGVDHVSSSSGVRTTPEQSVAVGPTQPPSLTEPPLLSSSTATDSGATSQTCCSGATSLSASAPSTNDSHRHPTPISPEIRNNIVADGEAHLVASNGEEASRKRARYEGQPNASSLSSPCGDHPKSEASDITMDGDALLEEVEADYAAEQRVMLGRFGRLTQWHLGCEEEDEEEESESDEEDDPMMMDGITGRIFTEMRAAGVDNASSTFGAFVVNQANRLLARAFAALPSAT